MPLSRLIYYSENQIDPAAGSVISQLSRILDVSNRNNRAVGLTGALVFDDLWFVQVLEGERQDIWGAFERIKDDERHARVTLVELRDITNRAFGNWWMGFAARSSATDAAFIPFLTNGRFDPPSLSGRHLMALTLEVAKLGLSREVKNAVA